MAAEAVDSTETAKVDSQVAEINDFEKSKVKKYFNQGGNFITGVDVTSKEAAEKRNQRLQRFGHTPIQTPSEVTFSLDKLQERARRFGVQAPVVNGEVVKCLKKLPSVSEGVAREEAVFVHGTNEMSTKDVLNYFALYGPSFLEWIDDASCNAVWEDPASARRALHGKGQYPVIQEADREKLYTDTIQPVWRLGEPHPKAKQLLLRLATSSDVKKLGAASRSVYYQKHKNTSLHDVKLKRKVKSTWREEDLRGRLRPGKGPEASAGEDTAEETEDMQEDESEDSEYENEDMEVENESRRIPSLVSIPKRSKEDVKPVFGKMRSDFDVAEEREVNDLRSKITLGRTKGVKSRLGGQI